MCDYSWRVDLYIIYYAGCRGKDGELSVERILFSHYGSRTMHKYMWLYRQLETWRATFNNFPFMICVVPALIRAFLVYSHPDIRALVNDTCGCWLNFSCAKEWHYHVCLLTSESHFVVLFLLFCVVPVPVLSRLMNHLKFVCVTIICTASLALWHTIFSSICLHCLHCVRISAHCFFNPWRGSMRAYSMGE